MRHTFLFAAVLLAGCYGGPDAVGSPSQPPTAAQVPISGLVYDSLTGTPLANVYLSVGDKVAQTGPDGSYQAVVSAGEILVRVRFGLYEEYRVEVAAHGPTRLDLPLRRLNPALMACALASDSIRAVIVELQGRKTLNRGEGSLLRLQTPTGDTTITAWDWIWRPLDPVTWLAAVPTGGRVVTGALWTLRDKQGFGDVMDCTAVPVPPAFPDPDQPPPPNLD